MGERYKRVPRFLSEVRLNAMLDAVSQGITDGKVILSQADKAARRITDKRGEDSVRKFLGLVPKIEAVDHIRPATKTEDHEWHTDKWVVLKKPMGGRRMLPLEIKSSDTGVSEFKNSRDFRDKPFYLVINSNKGRKDKEIIRDFNRELNRVVAELESRRKY